MRSLPAAVIATGLVMTSHPGTIGVRGAASAARALVAACALLLVFSALAQEGQLPNQSPGRDPGQNPSQAPSQGQGQSPSGLGLLPPPPLLLPNLGLKPDPIETFGHWLQEGTTRFKSDLQGAQETFDKLGKGTRDAAKDATDAVIGLPNARVVTARERCARAQNGGHDCQVAANALCRGKGFQTGRSLDTQSEQKCPARVLLEKRTPNDNECLTEIFVTRAVCQ